TGRDPAAGDVEWPDHDPDRGRLRWPDGTVDREVPRFSRWQRRRPCPADAARMGHDDLRLRRPPEALRDVLLRRPGEDEASALQRLRQVRIRHARDQLRGRHGLAVNKPFMSGFGGAYAPPNLT